MQPPAASHYEFDFQFFFSAILLFSQRIKSSTLMPRNFFFSLSPSEECFPVPEKPPELRATKKGNEEEAL